MIAEPPSRVMRTWISPWGIFLATMASLALGVFVGKAVSRYLFSPFHDQVDVSVLEAGAQQPQGVFQRLARAEVDVLLGRSEKIASRTHSVAFKAGAGDWHFSNGHSEQPRRARHLGHFRMFRKRVDV